MRHIKSHSAKTVELLEDRTLLTSLISIDDITIAEGDSGSATASITVTRTGDSSGDLNSLALVSFTTQDGTATTAEGDYIAQSGTLVFTADPTELTQTQMITVQINGDTLTEADETFQLLLTGSSSASSTISDDSGLVTISNDDSTTLSISDASAAENETLTFNVSLSEAAGVDISFRVNTQTGTADHSDYTFLSNQLVTIKAGDLSTDVTVHMHDDENQEGNETFTVVISDPQIAGGALSGTVTTAADTATGTIVNDDAVSGSVFNIQNMIVTEKDSGVANLAIRITRTGGSAGDLNFASSVDFMTVDGTSIAGEDYSAETYTVNFSASATGTSQIQTVYVPLYGDTYKEQTETFIGRLSNPTGGSILKGNVSSLDGIIYLENNDTEFAFQEIHYADPIYANHTFDYFGDSIAIDGDVMVVGARWSSSIDDQEGAAYVYVRNNQGTPGDESDDTWEYETTLLSGLPAVTGSHHSTEFGGSVAIDGDTIVVGAEYALVNSSSVGLVFVYTKTGSDWKTQPPQVDILDVSGTYSTQYFGSAVAIQDNTIVAGARGDRTNTTLSGAAYVFEKNGADWGSADIRQLLPSDPDSSDYFGSAVAIQDDLIVVGSPNDDDSGNNSGSAYVYTRNGVDWITNPPIEAKLTSSDGNANDLYGSSVATNGVDVAIGASNTDDQGSNSGSAYLYTRNGSDWTTTPPDELEFTGQYSNNFFGTSVDLTEDRLVAGAAQVSFGGSVHVYLKNGADWNINTVTESVLQGTPLEAQRFGGAVAISGNTIATGAPYTTFDGENSGAAYIFQSTTSTNWIQTDVVSPTDPLTSHNAGDEFGQNIVINDDYMLIVAPGSDSSLSPGGVVYLYARDHSGTPDDDSDDAWDYLTAFTAPDLTQTKSFGDSVAVDGDVIAISATFKNGTSEVYLYEQNGSDWTTFAPVITPLLTGASRVLNGKSSVAIDGDTIVVGNSDATGNASESGAVYLYLKAGADWSTLTPVENILVASDGMTGDQFGVSVDIDADKIIVGASGEDGRGAAYLYQQGVTGWDIFTEKKLVSYDIRPADNFGSSVTINGNIVIVSAPEADGASSISGAVYLYDGNAGWEQPEVTRFAAPEGVTDYSYAHFGRSISLDGTNLIVGATNGNAYIYDGASGWNNLKGTKLTYASSQGLYNQGFGSRVAFQGNSFVAGVLFTEFMTISSVYSYNQQTPTFSIEDASITENDNGTQTLNLTVSVTDIPDGLYNQPISIDFSTADGSATTADGDYQPLTGTLYFEEDSPLATQSQTISILINGDTKVELAETFSVTLSNPSVASDLSQGTAIVTINDNDTASLSISDVVVNEADGTATVTVSLDQPVPGNLTVDYATSQGTAIAGTDYSATSGTLSFVAGQQTQTITVDIYDDEIAELEDSFEIILSNLQSTGFNASLLDNTGSVIIQDNDRLYDFEFKSKFQATGTVHDGDHLGNDMAVDGDTMIVGAPFWDDVTNQGAALIYVRNRQGTHDDLSDDTWDYQSTLLAPDPFYLDRFGFKVAISGDTAVVGALTGDDGVNGSGSVYVFTRSGTAWSFQQELTASDAVSNDNFGEKLAIDGDTIVVGTVRNNSYTGAAYVFERANGVWSEITKLTASDAVAGQQFGNAIDIEGSTLVIGAYRDSEMVSQSGAVYVFRKFGGNWVETQKLKSAQLTFNGIFGSALSLEGENLVIGNPATFVTASYSGKAYLFTYDADTGIWSETQTLVPDDGNANAYFGQRVEIKNNLIVISSLRDADTAVNNGKVYTFVKQGATWVQSQKFISPDAADDDYFGKTFAVAEGALLVSASFDDEGGDATGSLYYFGAQAPVITVSDAVITEGDNGSRFISLEVTRTAANVGDLLLPATVDFTTIDGTATVAGGDYQASFGTLTFNGDPTVLTQTQIITIEIFGDTLVELDDAFSMTLSSLTGYGRIEDGTADIIIENDDQATLSINDVIVNEAAGKARLTVVLDAPVSTTVTLDYTTIDQSATATDDYLGQTGTLTFNPGELSQIIEIDLVNSVPVELAESFDIQFSNLQAGGLDVFLPDNLATVTIMDDDIGDYELKSQLYSIGSRHADDQFGFSLAVDGDTLISSSPGWDATYTDQGGAFIYVRNDQGTPEYTGDDTWEYQATLLAPDADNDTSDRFGHTVAISGDTAVVGALYGDEIAENAGSVFVFTRSNGVWTFQQELHVADTIGNGYFGEVVAIENDTIVVGARSTDVYTGSAYVFKRENNVWTQTAKLEADDAAPTANFGSSVDIENSTIVIGARLDSETEYWSGAVYIFKEQGGNWTQTQKLKDPTPAERGTFGTSVSLEGDLLLVGAISIPGQPESAGKAILYQLDHDSGLWNPIQTLTASDAAADSLFGVRVKIHEHQIFISSSSDPTGVNYNGAVYLFQQENQVWVEQQKFSDPAPNNGINFGRNLAVSNDTIFVAAQWDNDYAPNAGSIYVYGLPQNPTITIQDASVTETDDGVHLVMLNVTRTATKPGDLVYGATVDFRTVDGLATSAGSDYENTTGTITFAGDPTAASQTQSILIRVYGDLLVEADETFGIELLNVTGHAQISDAEATVTIQDDDQATITINDISVNEDAGTATLTVSLDQPVDREISVDYATADQTAVSHDDYTANSGILTFNPGVQSQTITVSIIDTDVVELDEKLLVNLSGLRADGRDVSLSDTQGEITIQDDDQARFHINDFTVDENAGVALVVITLDKPIDTAIDVTYSTTEINATEGLDYQYANGSVTFNPGELSKTVSVTIIDSALVEADERFAFSIGVLEKHGRDINTNAGYAEITIHDDDQARFSINDTTVNEDAGTATLTVTLDEEVAGTLQVDYYTTSLSATSPDDFQSTSGTLTFNQGVSTQTITIPIIDSELVELNESFLVSLSNIQPAFNVIFADSQGQITIQDDDQATITINDVFIDEDAGTATIAVSLDKPVDTAISVAYHTTDQSASASVDYQAASGTLTFSPEEQSKMITISLINDEIVELDETFLVNFSNLQVSGRNVILPDTQAQVTIQNDDQASLSINDIQVNEIQSTVTLTVSLDKEVDTTISVDYATADQTAVSPEDYQFRAGTLSFNPGQLSRTITVPLVYSGLLEPEESFLVNLTSLQHQGRNVSITDAQAEVTIIDHPPFSEFSILGEKIVEGDDGIQYLTFEIRRTGAIAGDLNFESTVDFSSLDGTAIAGQDYISKSLTLNFSAASTATSQVRYVDVQITGDLVKESTETVIGRISNPTGGSKLPEGANSIQTESIIANDDTEFRFQEYLYADPAYANHTEDNAGRAVAVDGDVMVMGVSDNSANGDVVGAAYVYVRNHQGTPGDQSDDTWELETVLYPESPFAANRFGSSVAIDGDTIVVGAEWDGLGGAIYVFTRNGADWVTDSPSVERITHEGISYRDNFGNAVAIYENTIIVGAEFEDSADSNAGAAYIFEKTGNDWSAPAVRQLISSDSTHSDNFGSSVSLHGDLIVVSAIYANAGGNNTGAAYVYTKNGSDWTSSAPSEAKITASNGTANDLFGRSVSTNGTEIAIGADNADPQGTSSGSTYLYIRNGADWSTISPTELEFTGKDTYDYFGTSIGLTADRLVIGAYSDNTTESKTGAVYVYSKNGVNWDPETISESVLTISSDEIARFGESVAVSGSTIVAGAPTIDLQGVNSGGAYIFEETAVDTWIEASEVTPTSSETAHNGGDRFGKVIASDENYLVVGAPGTDSDLASAGVVYVYGRDDAGTPGDENDDIWVYQTTFSAPDPAATKAFGTSVDVQGDTILVSTQFNNGPAEVYIYEMNGSDWTTIAPTRTALFNSVSRAVTQEVSVALDGDTIVAGVYYSAGNQPISGSAFVYTRNGSDWSTQAPAESVLFASDGTNGDRFGDAVDISGDQIIVGAYRDDNQGSAYLYQKGTTGWDAATETKLTANDTLTGDYFGKVVVIEGNLVAVGSPQFDSTGTNNGAVYLFDGSQGWENPVMTRLDPQENSNVSYYGSSLALQNGTLVVGNSGTVYIYDHLTGDNTYEETVLSFPSDSDLYGRGFGAAVAFQGNNLIVTALYNESSASSKIFSFNRQTPAFTVENTSITENDSGTRTLELTVTASGIIPGLYADPISIDLASVSGSALAGSDFLAFSDTIVFDNNAATSTQTKTISIEIIGDTDVEAEESFSVVLSNPSVEANLVQDTGVVTILDNDIATMNISNIEVNEDDGSAVLTVTLDKPVQTTIIVDYATAPQTAAAVDDFISTAGTLTFNPGEQSKIITVLLVDTGLVEVDEDFLVNLSGIQSNGHQVVFSQSQAQVTISDDDQAAISIDDTTVDEDAGTVTLTVSLDQPVDTTISVDYATSNQTAGAADDYQSTSGTLTFNPGEQSKTITIPIADSSLVELDETFLVTLSALQAGGRDVIFADSEAQVTIHDDDQAAFSIDDTTVDEDAGTVTLTVALDQPVDTTVTVDYTTSDQTAGAPDDYQSTTGALTFNPGEQSKTITILIADSSLVELDETFLVTLSALQAGGRDVIFADSQAQVTIHDDDQATISIDDTTVDEDAGTITLTVALDQPVDTTISVDYATSDQTAGAADDYQSTTGTLIFNPGEQSKTITIPIADSSLVELDETFLVTLSALQAGGRNVILADSEAQVTIHDDDQAAISIDDTTVNEAAGTVTLTVALDQPVDTTISVDYATSDQTAGAADDYQSTTGTLTFNPGEQSKTIIIPIADSSLVELDETFLVTLSTLQAGGRNVILADNQAQVTIHDDDQAAISIDDTTVDEAAGTVTLTVSLDQPVDTAITLEYATTDQTAKNPDDYTATSGTITFNPGEQLRTISIPIIDSNLIENNETFLVNLSGLQNHGRDVILDDSQVQVTVNDDDQVAAEINLRVVGSPSNTSGNDELVTLPTGRDWVGEWSTYWVEFWIDAQNPANQGILSTGLDFSYQTQYTSATEIEYGAAFTQNRSGLIDDATGTIENLYAETDASQRGASSYLLFARIKFEPLSEDQVLLDLNGKSIGPYDLEFEISSPQVILEETIPLDTVAGAYAGTEIWANPYDLNDDDQINYRDLILFVGVYNVRPSESGSDYAWFADLDKNDRVNYRDLISFVSNYGKSKLNHDVISYPANFPEAANDLLTVDTQYIAQPGAQPLQQTTVESMLHSAVEQVNPQLSAADSQKLETINIQVTDLKGDSLGRAAGNTIYIDSDAAAYGWFIDTTPATSEEFTESVDLTLIALPESSAAGRVDLLTVILHELGHLLGYDHEESGLMQESLVPGVRKLPAWENDADQFFTDLTDDLSIIL